ncbi:MAG: GNAT family N-acetyltransferase [Paracoccaceae bacterium]
MAVIAMEGAVRGALALTPRQGPGGVRLLASTTNGHARYAVLFLPEGTADVLRKALTQRPGWDALRLEGLNQRDADALTTAFARAGHRVETERRFHSLLRRSGPDAPPLPAPSSKTRRRRDRQERAFAETGRLEWVDATGPDSVSALDAFIAGEAQSWKAATGEPLNASPEIAGFYRTLAQGSDPTLRVTLLKRDGTVVAGLICVEANGERVALKTFYDMDLKRHSPGMMVLRRAAQQVDNAPDFSRLDLFSDWSQYDGLANDQRALCDLTIWNSTPRATLLRLARIGLRRLRGS